MQIPVWRDEFRGAQTAGLSFAGARREARQDKGGVVTGPARKLRSAQMHSASGRTRQASGLCSPGRAMQPVVLLKLKQEQRPTRIQPVRPIASK